MWNRISYYILHRRRIIMSVVLALTAFFGFEATRIEMSYQYAPLLPETDSAYVAYRQFVDLYGNEGNTMVVGVRDRRFFDRERFALWRRMASRLRQVEGVSSVFSASEACNLHKDTARHTFVVRPVFADTVASQADLDSMAAVFVGLPFYDGKLHNAKNSCYLMSITLCDSMLFSSRRVELIAGIRSIVDDYSRESGCEVHYSGLPYIRVTTAQMVMDELLKFLALAVGVTVLIIFLFFRSGRIISLSVLVVAVAVVWTLGLQGLLGYRITILTAMLPPLIIVIAIPNILYILNKYYQEYRRIGYKKKAIRRVVIVIGNASLLTNLTTALGFGTFIFTSSRILVEFGLVASVSIMFVYVISLLLTPILFSLLPPPSDRHVRHLDNRVIRKVISTIETIIRYRRHSVYAVAVCLFALGLVGIGRMHTTGYMLDDIPHHDKLYTDLKFFEKNFDGLMPVEVMVDMRRPNAALQTSNIGKLDSLQREIGSLPEVSDALSLVEVVKFARQAFYNGNPARYGLPNRHERNFILSYVGHGRTQPQFVSTFVDSLHQRVRLNFRMADIGTTRMRGVERQLHTAIDSIFPPERYTTLLTGASIIYARGTDYLVSNLFSSLALAIVLISLFMALMFRSRLMVLISILPNMIPLVLTAGLMGFLDIPIKPSTVLVFSIAFGISVDDAIHYLAKYRLDLRETNWSIRGAVTLALRETGVSMVYTSVTLFFGFVIFSLSDFGGTQALGILVAITLLVAMFSNLLLLPSLLMSLDRKLTRKAFGEPMLDIFNEEADIDLDDLEIDGSKAQTHNTLTPHGNDR